MVIQATKPKGTSKKKDGMQEKKPSGVAESAAIDGKTSGIGTPVKVNVNGSVKARQKVDSKKSQNDKRPLSEKAPTSDKLTTESSKRSAGNKRQRDDSSVGGKDGRNAHTAKRRATSNVFSEGLGLVFSRILSGIERVTQRVTGFSSSLFATVIAPFSNRI